MHKFWIVFGQVYRKNVRSGSWLFLVLSPLLFALLMGAVFYFISQSSAGQPGQIAVVSDNAAVAQAVKKQSDGDTHYRVYASTAAAERALTKEDLDGVLTVKTTPTISATYVERSGADNAPEKSTVVTMLSQLKLQQNAAKLNLTQTQLASLLTPAVVTHKTVAIEHGKRVAKSDLAASVNQGLAFVLTIFTMLITVVYGSLLAQEIATEKGSRIMEILLSSVSATTQFFGKIAAMLALLLTQLAAYVIVGGLGWVWLRQQSFVKDLLKEVDLSMLAGPFTVIAVLFFLVGVLSYVVLAAMTGSLVSNQEQVNAAVMPISLISLAGYLLAFMAQTGDSTILRVASYIPFLNISVMPVRLALGQATYPAAVVSLVIGAVFLTAFTWLAARVYRSNVLVYSDAGLWRSLQTSWTIWRSEHGKQG